MRLYLEAERPGLPLYVNVPDAQPLILKGIDPIKWARKFDWTNGSGEHAKHKNVASSHKEDDQLYLKINKSIGDEWIDSFIGTPLFDEAYALCQQSLDLQSKRNGKVPADVNLYKEEDKLRLKKDRLKLQLAKLRDGKFKKIIEKIKGTEKSVKARAGQEDLTNFVNDLMDNLPGETLKKKGSNNGR